MVEWSNFQNEFAVLGCLGIKSEGSSILPKNVFEGDFGLGPIPKPKPTFGRYHN